MAEAIIREWLTDYKTLSSSEIHSFANTIQQSNDLIKAIFSILEEKKYHNDFLEPVCHQLFSFYRSKEENLQQFALQYLPTLIGIYLGAVARGERKAVRCVEVLLLGVYNLKVIDSSGKPVNQTFRIPSISKPSIYHKTISLSHLTLTEHALSNLEYGDSRTNIIGPYPEVEKINASNRLQVMTVLMWVYNQSIGYMSRFSHMSLCKMCTRTTKQGYCNRAGMSVWSSYGNDSGHNNPHPRPIPRIPLSPPLLLEMLHASYFSIFNGLAGLGLQALEDINFRAMQDMMSDVLMVTNAIRNSLKENPSGIPSDGPMGISVALSPTTSTTVVSKAAITNASFRTKKLPDDIPIQSETATSESNQLSAINEEADDSSLANLASSRNPKRRGSTGSNNITGSTTSKFPVLQLRKDKDRNKERKKEAIISEPNFRSKKDLEISTSLPLNNIKNGEEVNNVTDESDTSELCTDREEILIKSSSFPGNFKKELDICSKITSNIIPDKCNPNSEGEFSNSIENNTNMFINHTKETEEAVITNDGKIILQSTIHKQDGEGGKGKQNSLQTVV